MKKLKSIFKTLGPGFITGAADDDPSGIGTYSQTGAQFGYSQLWFALFSFPFMTVVQEICGRIGLVTGMGLAGVLKKHYGRPILIFSVFILFLANAINIGADLGAMAASIELFIKAPFILLLFAISIATVGLEVFVPYPTYARFLKYLTLSLFAYVITVFVVKQNWTVVFKSTLVPHFSLTKDYLLNLIALLGTTISPYLFFWQADEEVEEEIEKDKIKDIGVGKPKVSKKDIKKLRVDTIAGMLFSNIVTFFIILTVASTLGSHGINSIQTADQAASALKPFAGNFAFILFTLGIIGTGLLAVPILAGSASYAVAEGLDFKAGLSKKFTKAKYFYLIIAIATIVGISVNFLPIKPFQLLYYSAVLNGICAPILLVLIMLVSGNSKIMGDHKNSKTSNLLGWFIAILMSIASLILLLSFSGILK